MDSRYRCLPASEARSGMIEDRTRSLQIGPRTFEWGAKTYVMAVLNVTPDSFSGDGVGADIDRGVERAREFEALGADIIDVGGESTRPPSVYPDAKPVPQDEELRRVLPVIEAVSRSLTIPVSIDTRKAEVARRAVHAGASMVNDVTMLKGDPRMAEVVGSLGVPVVISHNRSRAKYDDVIGEVIADLMKAVMEAESAGVLRDRILLDPGIGFGKTAEQSLEVMRHLAELTQLSFPVLFGSSRKSSIGAVLGTSAGDRVEGTAATVALAIDRGADIVRVHDVREMVRVAKMSDAVVRGWTPRNAS